MHVTHVLRSLLLCGTPTSAGSLEVKLVKLLTNAGVTSIARASRDASLVLRDASRRTLHPLLGGVGHRRCNRVKNGHRRCAAKLWKMDQALAALTVSQFC